MGEKKPRFTIFRKISPFSLAKCFSLCYNIDTERQKGAFRPSPCGVLCPAHDFIGIIPQRATSAHPFFCPRPPPPRTGTLFVPFRFPAKKMRSSQPCLLLSRLSYPLRHFVTPPLTPFRQIFSEKKFDEILRKILQDSYLRHAVRLTAGFFPLSPAARFTLFPFFTRAKRA